MFDRAGRTLLLAAWLIPWLITGLPGSAQTEPRKTAAPGQRAVDTDRKPPAIERDVAKLPARVAATREKIMEAAASGDLEKLRLAAERNELPPLFIKGQAGDPIAGLKARSGDGEGRETLAILLNVLSAPYVRVSPGTSREMFVWPWFAEYAPDKLDAEQLVEVYRVLRAAEFKDSRDKGKYVGWRLGIGPDGTWHYFLTGE